MMTARIVHAVVVLTLLPLLTLRGRWRWRYLAIDLATYALAAIVWGHVDGIEGYAAAASTLASQPASNTSFTQSAHKWRSCS